MDLRLILIFGIILIIDPLSALFSRVFQGLSRVGQASPEQPTDGFISGCILGASLSLIWVPCGGPILAAAIVQSAVQKTYFDSVLILCFFALGSIIPLLLIGTVGRQLITQLQFLKSHSVLIRKILGIIMILSAVWALSGPRLPDKSPMVDAPNVVVPTVKAQDSLIGGLAQPYPTPALRGITEWINSPPLTLSELKGKVVLIDFWTYSCINCVRTIPELNAWYKAYHDKGLVIIGIHSPEFEFEKNADNVKRAVADYQIHYPVGLDNDYGTWLSFHNIYWPAQYLIDRNGMVVYENFGEGNAEVTEQNILTLLNIPGIPLSAETPHIPKPSEALQTPELYFGSKRASAYAGIEPLSENTTQQYSIPNNIPKDNWALSGGWKIEPERIITTHQHARIACRFFAGKVFAVMGSVTDQPITVTVLLNGHPIGAQGGKDLTHQPIGGIARRAL